MRLTTEEALTTECHSNHFSLCHESLKVAQLKAESRGLRFVVRNVNNSKSVAILCLFNQKFVERALLGFYLFMSRMEMLCAMKGT